MTFKKLLSKYRHIWTLLYGVIYMPIFMYLEKTVTTDYHEIHCALDDKIPFCEYFIVPYYLWFGFVAAVMIYLFFYSRTEFYQACAFLFTGMTIFLLISAFYHNGVNLRESIPVRDNIFYSIVEKLHETDTSTNVFPSIHVFNTLGCLAAILKSKGMKKHVGIRIASIILSILIILSTMFLKQHSVIDVAGGIILGAIMYLLVYIVNWKKVFHKEDNYPELSEQTEV